jgi:hypothetical protein
MDMFPEQEGNIVLLLFLLRSVKQYFERRAGWLRKPKRGSYRLPRETLAGRRAESVGTPRESSGNIFATSLVIIELERRPFA